MRRPIRSAAGKKGGEGTSERCVLRSPGVGGAKPRRPRESIALFNSSTPPGVARNNDRQRERHPIGVVYIRRIAGNPGSSALRASTAGLKSDDPSGVSPLRDRQAGVSGDITGVTGGVAPLRGASFVAVMLTLPLRDLKKTGCWRGIIVIVTVNG